MIKNVPESDRLTFNRIAPHPLQSWDWGVFRNQTGVEVVRLGRYEKNRLVEGLQCTIHPIPHLNRRIAYIPKTSYLSTEMAEELVLIGKKHNCIFMKLEPQVHKIDQKKFLQTFEKFPLRLSSHPLFTQHTFVLDLTHSEEELLAAMHQKTRYNIRVAQRHTVTVEENNSQEMFEQYWRLTEETTHRQRFFAHDRHYHEVMWETLRDAGMAHLLVARLPKEQGGVILAAWILLLFNDVLYYPYGASSSQHRNTMASTLMLWEAMRFGKKNGAKKFDLWGSLGPDPDPKDSWYGFHRFKQGFNPIPTEYAGSFDLVIDPAWYAIYDALYGFRSVFLNIKAALRTMKR
jgi:lipid II:glycine glycyltransferase (peptidoglycan interpeptide bridge formation enzyme)